MPLLLRRAWYGLNQAFRRRIAHSGLTPDQFTVMRTLRENEDRGLTQRELSRLMASDPNTVAALLERMEQNGLIERRPRAADRRANELTLRPDGRRRYDALRAAAVALQEEVLAVLPPTSRERFLSALERVAEACQIASGRAAGDEKRRDTGLSHRDRLNRRNPKARIGAP